MSAIRSSKDLTNDQFGYSCYTLVVPAGEALTAQVESLRNQMGVTVASIPAHVTVKGTFYDIDSLEQVKQLVEEITRSTAPFFISFSERAFHWWADGGALTVPATPPIQALHDTLVATISPLGKPAYRDDPYLVHMTLVYGQSPERLQQAQALVQEMDFGPGFMAESVDLMGRVGQAVGGEWRLITRFGLGD
ncbi:MAG: 2'-5' RNA ligase family protein [Caldilineaceae bacterium]|nr:2'-5' RNA ligase family protein [Caldilineaceae bacterium]